MKVTPELVTSIVQFALIPLLGIVIRAAIKKPNDAQRAAQIAHIADGIVATIYAVKPNLGYRVLVDEVLRRLKQEAGVPTANAAVLERAAQAAVLKAGVRPS